MYAHLLDRRFIRVRLLRQSLFFLITCTCLGACVGGRGGDGGRDGGRGGDIINGEREKSPGSTGTYKD